MKWDSWILWKRRVEEIIGKRIPTDDNVLYNLASAQKAWKNDCSPEMYAIPIIREIEVFLWIFACKNMYMV